jgi:hypothetical protein
MTFFDLTNAPTTTKNPNLQSKFVKAETSIEVCISKDARFEREDMMEGDNRVLRKF